MIDENEQVWELVKRGELQAKTLYNNMEIYSLSSIAENIIPDISPYINLNNYRRINSNLFKNEDFTLNINHGHGYSQKDFKEIINS